MAEFAGPGMPFALQVIKKDFVAVVVLRPAARGVFDTDIVEAAWPGLKAYFFDLASGIKQQGGVQPEHARLKVVALTSYCNGLSHRIPNLPGNTGP